MISFLDTVSGEKGTGKFKKVKDFSKYLQKLLSQLIMKQTIGYTRYIVYMGSVATFIIVLITCMKLIPQIKLCVIYRI